MVKMSTGVAHVWHPIEDLPRGWEALAVPELRALGEVWSEQKGELESSGALGRFVGRLNREWAIETGIIERVYTLDRGVTEILVEQGIYSSLIPHDATDTDPELLTAMIRDHESAINWLFQLVRGDRPLSTSFIRELHALMTRHQRTASGRDQFGRPIQVELLHGEWKQLPNNPTRADETVHEYCPPEQVASEMDRLVELHAQHEGLGVEPEVEAAWLHHRFTEIHPFQDGNGRVARAIASLVFLRGGWFPLVVVRTDKDRYLDALGEADRGELRPLVDLFAKLQRRAFTQALSIAGQTLQEGEQVDQVIASIAEVLAGREEDLRQEWGRAKTTANQVLDRARLRLASVRDRLESSTGKRFYVDIQPDGGELSHWHRGETIEVARKLGYFANSRDYRAWARLKLVADSEAFVLLSLTAVGPQFRGVIGASLAFFWREQTDEGQGRVVGVTPASDELFQINYREQEASALQRFDGWFEAALACALEMWRRGL